MSGTTTVSGSSVPNNFTGAAGAAFATFFNSNTPVTLINSSGAETISGAALLTKPNLTVTLTGATAVADTTSGGNSINVSTTGKEAIFTAANDTVTASSGATTLFGASSGVTHFSVGGASSSIVGGTGALVGSVSGANSTLIGGTGNSLFTVSGSNDLVVAGSSGTTGVSLVGTTGPETIATNPNGGNGQLVAVLGSGADSVIGGGGASTITAGSGNDVFGFVNGHAGGSEVIIGFNASDNIAFEGYGYSAANTPTENVTAAGDVITLSDGTTITLAGVDHKIF